MTPQDSLKKIFLDLGFHSREMFLVACSGGADSTVLAALLKDAGARFGLAHCNFALRGKESNEDEKFCKAMAEKLKVPIHTERFDTAAYCKMNRVSIQMGARELRYQWLEKVRIHHKYNFILTGHHADDQAETILLHLIRGTGLRGIRGMKPKQGFIVRPLLETTRREIELWAASNKIKFRNDSSNAKMDYARNAIRHKVIPVFKEINPSVISGMLTFSRMVAGPLDHWNRFLDEVKKKFVKRNQNETRIYWNRLKSFPNAEIILGEILAEFSFALNQLPDLSPEKKIKTGKKFFSGSHTLFVERNCFLIKPKEIGSAEKDFPVSIQVSTKNLRTNLGSFKFRTKKILNFAKGIALAKRAGSIAGLFDLNKLSFPLIVEPWKDGDYFYPLGLNRRKLVSDFLTDQKIPASIKRKVLVIRSGNSIVRICGLRSDHRFSIVPETRELWMVED